MTAYPKRTRCYRHLAVYRPGEPMPGVMHWFAWDGAVPCTGTLRCVRCGLAIEDTTNDLVANEQAKRDSTACSAAIRAAKEKP